MVYADSSLSCFSIYIQLFAYKKSWFTTLRKVEFSLQQVDHMLTKKTNTKNLADHIKSESQHWIFLNIYLSESVSTVNLAEHVKSESQHWIFLNIYVSESVCTGNLAEHVKSAPLNKLHTTWHWKNLFESSVSLSERLNKRSDPPPTKKKRL